MKALSLATVMVACASALPAQADDHELQLGLMPGFTILARHGQINKGFGGSVLGTYGLSDWFGAGGEFACAYFKSMADSRGAAEEAAATLYYDATRCDLAAFGSLRVGTRAHATLDAGVGYRFEVQSARRSVNAANILVDNLDKTTRHNVVALFALSFEYRFYEPLSIQARARYALPVLSHYDAPPFDLTFGVFLGFYFYP